MTADTLYKILGLKGEAIHGGSGTWALPTGRRPGRWMTKIANPSPCERGYHLVTAAQAREWITSACRIFEAEGRGATEAMDDKSVWAQARLVRETAWTPRCNRLLAADYAARVLHLFERERSTDDRPRQAILVARKAAAWDAAWAAAWDAAWDAARAAERTWQTERFILYLTQGEAVEPWPLPEKGRR